MRNEIELNKEDLKSKLQENEQIEYMFVQNAIESKNGYAGDFNCKNCGEYIFISSYVGYKENTHVIITCDKCGEIVFEYKPYAVRRREII